MCRGGVRCLSGKCGRNDRHSIRTLTATNPSAVAEDFVAKTIWVANIALRHRAQSRRRFQTQLSQCPTHQKRTALLSVNLEQPLLWSAYSVDDVERAVSDLQRIPAIESEKPHNAMRVSPWAARIRTSFGPQISSTAVMNHAAGMEISSCNLTTRNSDGKFFQAPYSHLS